MPAAAELLESIASNRELLAGVSEAERTRLLSAGCRSPGLDAARMRRQLSQGVQAPTQGRQIRTRRERASPDRSIRNLQGRQTVCSQHRTFFRRADFKQIEVKGIRISTRVSEEQTIHL